MKLLYILFILFWSTSSYSTPMYYTFEGDVVFVRDDAGAASIAGIGLGSLVSYTFLVDYDLDGTFTENGTTTTITDSPGDHFYFADYISGSAMSMINGGSGDSRTENNYGNDHSAGHKGSLRGNSNDELVGINIDNLFVSELSVGDFATGISWAYDNLGNNSYVRSDLSLVSIKPATVSAPPVYILFIIGIILLVYFNHRILYAKYSSTLTNKKLKPGSWEGVGSPSMLLTKGEISIFSCRSAAGRFKQEVTTYG